MRCSLVLQQRMGTQHKWTTERPRRGAGGEPRPLEWCPSEVHRLPLQGVSMTHYLSSKIRETPDSTDTFTFDSSGFGAACVAPNWIRWVQSDQVDSDGAVNLDNDGEYPADARPIAVIDLSAALSHQLGRQIAQNQTFRVSYLSVECCNADDTLDNKESAAFQGRVRWYSPTHHRVEAYQMYRDAWRSYYTASTNTLAFDDEGTAVGGGTYKGLRMGLVEPDAVDGSAVGEQVPFQSTDPFTDIEGTVPNLNPIFNAYDKVLPSGAVDKKPANALWTSGRTGYPDGIDWAVSFKNTGDNALNAAETHFEWSGDADVMCGLLCLDIGHSATQRSIVFTDEYFIRVTIGVEGWGGDF